MGRNTRGGRGHGPDRRRGADQARRASLGPVFDSLEERRLLAGGGGGTIGTVIPTGGFVPTSNNVGDVTNGPLAKAGATLIAVYQDYTGWTGAGGIPSQYFSSYHNLIRFQGDQVGVQISVQGSIDAYLQAASKSGLNITGVDLPTGTVAGYVPISNLVQLANTAGTGGISPIYIPHLNQQGIADDQGNFSLAVQAARAQFGVDGTGVKIGVISDSVNEAANPNGRPPGIAGSVATGDLPASGVTVIADEPVGVPGFGPATDEGRAMLEEIHDLAPGAQLYFATGETLDNMGFANNIKALAAAGCNVIVDDLGDPQDPFFQDGITQQAINQVTSQGVIYLSSAGNQGAQGVEAPVPGVVTATVGGVSGQFVNFNPSGGTLTQYPIAIAANQTANLEFQFDQPFYGNKVTSNVNILYLNASNAIVAQGNSNTIAQGTPYQNSQVPSTATSFAIQIVSGPNIGRFKVIEADENVQFTPSTQFGSAGGYIYTTTSGHNAGATTISTGAVPWFGTPPYSTVTPIATETFSSAGPVNILFDPNGNRLPAPDTLLKPDVSGVDGINTSFFGQIGTIPTTVPGLTNVPPGENFALPNFFGTSAAAPNLAAIAVLMKQLNPNVTYQQVDAAFIASAAPVNGSAPGQWNNQGGFGLVNATAALNVIDQLRVTATVPVAGQVTDFTPNSVTFTFNKPVNVATLSPADLTVTPPAGDTVTVGQPALTFPGVLNVVTFPLFFTHPAYQSLNGTFSYTLNAGSITATDGQPLLGYSSTFVINDVTPPKVASTQIVGRVVYIGFTKAIDPTTISPATVQFHRFVAGVDQGNLAADPRAILTFNAITNQAVLDLSNLPQQLLPTGDYYIIVGSSVADVAGTQLDGHFNNVFPSGDYPVIDPDRTFIQNLGVLTLTAPQVISFQLSPVNPNSDTGIPADQNTNDDQPTFVGQVNQSFPGSLSGLTVVAQFNGLPGPFDLAVGAGGRGYTTGDPNTLVTTTTDANGRFTFRAPGNLNPGFNSVKVVIVAQTDAPPLPGLSAMTETSFREDFTPAYVGASSLPDESTVSGLKNLSVFVVDTNLTPGLPVPLQFSVPALNPATVSNLSDYQLVLLNPNVALDFNSPATYTDYSTAIASANFVATTVRTLATDPYTGRIDLTFQGSLPAGRYIFRIRAYDPTTGVGVSDAAGNPLNGNVLVPGIHDYLLGLNINPTPAYVVNELGVSPSTDPANNPGPILTGPRSEYELTGNGPSYLPAAPTQFVVDFSSPLDPTTVSNSSAFLIASADTYGGKPDGNFGTFGITNAPNNGNAGFSVVPGTTVTLMNSVGGATFGQPGFDNRLLIQIPAGTTLAPDYYRLYIPNFAYGTDAVFGATQPLKDVFGNQIDGEFLGDQNLAVGPYSYEDLLPDGTYRAGISGDGVAGGAFVSGFSVVPNGDVIYANPDYNEDPYTASQASDGSPQHPYSVLAPQAAPDILNADPTAPGGYNLNSVVNFGTGFNPQYDRANRGKFARSAFYAASVLVQQNNGPVVILAEPGTPFTNPATGASTQNTYVLQAPRGSSATINDGSGSVPAMTTLVMQPGSTLKLENAALLVQNQGSALQADGGTGPGQRVTFTSLADNSVGQATSDVAPQPGDWGGIVFRNFDDQNTFTNPTTGQQINRNTPFPVDGRLGISGSDDAMSVLNNVSISYGGGVVPQGNGTHYDSVTLYNSRPTLTNISIANGTDASISGDLDSFREDDTARGPLVRRAAIANNSLNGIYVRALPTGQVQMSDAVNYPDNPAGKGAPRNFTFDSSLPYLFLSTLYLGQETINQDNGATAPFGDRLYIQPGQVLKFSTGSGIFMVPPTYTFSSATGVGTLSTPASINIGDRNLINGFDNDPNYAPLNIDGSVNANYVPESTTDAKVIFTTIFDAAATSVYVDNSVIDPATGKPLQRTVVAPLDSNSSSGFDQPTPTNVDRAVRWGGLTVQEGDVAQINGAVFQYGGGPLNLDTGTIKISPVLRFVSASGNQYDLQSAGVDTLPPTYGFDAALGFHVAPAMGTRASVTNNEFLNNFEAAIGIDPNGLLAADPLRPLESGHPFFRGNVLQGNTYNGLRVLTFPSINNAAINPPGIIDAQLPENSANQTVSTLWDATDITYILRGTIVLDGYSYFAGVNNNGNIVVDAPPVPDPNNFTAPRTPFITLTIQSALPGMMLADGSTIAKPGESVVVKLLNFNLGGPAGNQANIPGTAVPGAANIGSSLSDYGGAGFLVGVDNGIDPPAPGGVLVDPGYGSQIRILGIGGNETTGQTRVPTIITSLLDNSVGPIVDGVSEQVAYPAPTAAFDPTNANGSVETTATPGDGGLIYFGSGALPSYDLYDPRYGSIINNADIRYLTRIEVQQGGIVDALNLVPASTSFVVGDIPGQQGLGVNARTQNNLSGAISITGSNLSNFSQAGVFVHPGHGLIVNDIGSYTGNGGFSNTHYGTAFRATPFTGPATTLFLENDTLANMPYGISAISYQGIGPFVQGDTQQDATFVIALNDTFNNTNTGLATFAPPGQEGPQYNAFSAVVWLAMNDIFSNNSIGAIVAVGQQQGSQGQYDLFYNNGTGPGGIGTDVSVTGQGIINDNFGGFGGINGSIQGNPNFRNAAGGDFRLLSNSPAINAARSEFGPNQWGNQLEPIVQSDPTQANYGDRTNNGRIGAYNQIGGVTLVDANGNLLQQLGINSTDIVALPGSPQFNYPTDFVAAVPTGETLAPTPGATPGASSAPGTYYYAPSFGQRDQLGYLRQDVPGTPIRGYGSQPYFSIGAFQYRQFFPPDVVPFPASRSTNGVPAGVLATKPDGTTADLYKVGGIGGINVTPVEIQIAVSRNLNPATVNGSTVQLLESGGTGNFTPGSPLLKVINLGGKVQLDPNNARLIDINLAGLNLPSDEYRIILSGSGANVITDTSGNALDGLNLDASGNQLPLPSGPDGFPGSNFQVTFIINSVAPTIVAGSLRLSPASETGIAGDPTTNINKPTFIGQISEANPLIVPIAGQTIILSVFDYTTGTYVPVGTGTTTATGSFSVTPTSALPDSPYDVGPDGIFGTSDDLNYGSAEVTATDTSGNVSQPALATYVLDTAAPTVVSFTPSNGALASVDSAGNLLFTVTFDKNINFATLNSTDITVTRANNGKPVPLTITPGSITPIYHPAGDPLHNSKGEETVTFSVGGATVNDVYTVTLTSGIKDLFGNSLAGGSFTTTTTVFSPANSRDLFVGATAAYQVDPTATVGTRNNPYATVTLALAAALPGDVVAVLPGVYDEDIALKSLVHVMSVDPASTVGALIPGDAQTTTIRGLPTTAKSPAVTVTATNLFSIPGLDTEISGLAIDNSLLGDPVFGIIDPVSIGLRVVNSNILADKNIFLDNGSGVDVETSGANAATPRLLSNIVAGNNNGILLNDANVAASLSGPTAIYNNDIVHNTYGIYALDAPGSSILGNIVNNILWENRTNTSDHTGDSIFSTVTDKLLLSNNLFSSNGPDLGVDAVNVGNGFDPTALSTSHPDGSGNFIGNPAFVSPRDPRGDGDTPAVFYLDANFDLTLNSAAINNALAQAAPATDFLSRTAVRIPGLGFPGYGPASIGAYYPNGTGGVAVGGSFRVAATSLSPVGQALADGGFLTVAPGSITIDFSVNVDRSTLSPSALQLSGNGLNPANPAKVTGLVWLDNHTAQFLLSGSFLPTGTVVAQIAGGAAMTADHSQALAPYFDTFNLAVPAQVTPTNPNPTPTPPPTTPPPAAPPTGKKGKVVHKPVHKAPVHKAPARHTPVAAHPSGPAGKFAKKK